MCSSDLIALSISLFAIGIAVSQLLIGPLSDIIGRKGLLLSFSLSLSIVIFTWFFAVDDMAMLTC